MDLYDEFGNYIGDEEDDGEEDDGAPEIADEDDEDDEEEAAGNEDAEMMEEEEDDTRIVLHEDKKYYPTAIEVYGEEVETTVQEEDSQPITQPIVAPVVAKDYDLVEKTQPGTVYSTEFFTSMMNHANLVRNVAVRRRLGHPRRRRPSHGALRCSSSPLLLTLTTPRTRLVAGGRAHATREDDARRQPRRPHPHLR